MSHNNDSQPIVNDLITGFLNIFQRSSPSNSANNVRTVVKPLQEDIPSNPVPKIFSEFKFVRLNSPDMVSSETSVSKKRVKFSEPISSTKLFSEEYETPFQKTDIESPIPDAVVISNPLPPVSFYPISLDDEYKELNHQISEDVQQYLNSIFNKFNDFSKKILEIDKENDSLERKLASNLTDLFYQDEDQDIKTPRFCGCFERLKKLIVKNKSIQIKPLITEIDIYDDLYQGYIKGIIKKNYLAFILVNEYQEVFKLSKTYGSVYIPRSNEITDMVNFYFNDAIEFFCDYANENAKYDLRLSLEQVNNFLKLYKEFFKVDREGDKVSKAYNKILSTFSDQEKNQQLINFFSEPNLNKSVNLVDNGLFYQNFQELEDRILHAIDNPLDSSLSIDQQKKICEIYLKIKGNDYDDKTLKIASHSRQLNDKKEEVTKKGVKSLVMFYESKESKRNDISLILPEDSLDKTKFTSEIKFEENILKKTFIDSLKYRESAFNLNINSNIGRVLNNPIPKPLVVEASQVMEGVKYRLGTEFCC